MNDSYRRRPLIVAGTVLGVGMGGFVDGILFHQLLQLHNMLSAKYPTRDLPYEQLVINLEVNMFWDGMFHAMTWLITATGIWLLWTACGRADVPHSSQSLFGSVCLGWGLFNLVEGIVDHHILHLHHVTESANHVTWDIAFLASGLFLFSLGMLCITRAKVGGDDEALANERLMK